MSTSDVAQVTWAELNTKGLHPTPRWGHVSLLVDSCMLVVGGGDVDEHQFGCLRQPQNIDDSPSLCDRNGARLCLETLQWSTAYASNSAPNNLKAHSAVLIGREVYCFGGDGRPTSSLAILNVDQGTWREESHNPAPAPTHTPTPDPKQ